MTRLSVRTILLATACVWLTYIFTAWLVRFEITSITFTAVQQLPEGPQEWSETPAALPYEQSIETIATRNRFDIRLAPGPLPEELSVMVDDCIDALSVNGTSLGIEKRREKDRCGWGLYRHIYVGGLMRPSGNSIDITVSDQGKVKYLEGNHLRLSLGNMLAGMRVEIPVILGFAVICLLGCFACPLGRRTIDPPLRLLLTIGLVFYAWRLIYFSFTWFGDIYPHMEYIHFLRNNHALPDAAHGWETFQPPAYYLLAWLFYDLGELIGAGNPIELVRCIGIGGHLVFLLYALATMRLLITSRAAFYLAAILLIFWPAGFAQAGKINNDVLLFPLAAASIYYLLCWQKSGGKKEAWLAVALALLSIGVKSNGVLILFGVAVAMLCKRPYREWLPSRLAVGGLLALAVLCMGMNFGRIAYSAFTNPAPRHFLFANTPKEVTDKSWNELTGDPVAVRNLFFGFDARKLVEKPFDLPEPASKRLFWNMLHMLFLLNLESRFSPQLSSACMGLYLAMLAYSIAAAAWIAARDGPGSQRLWLAPLAILAAGIGGLMYNWALTQYGSVDARYIFFCVPWLIAWFLHAAEWYRAHGNRLLAFGGFGLGILLAACFVLLAMSQTYF